jgi:hypothetical protein
LGGFCGFYGACGAGVGTGIFLSLILKTTPLSGLEWQLCNQITSDSLRVIAESGGPRCCKRDSFLALQTAVVFLKEKLDIILPMREVIQCEFSDKNKECLKTACTYYIH